MRHLSRRRVLGAIGGSGAVAIAGCTGEPSVDSPDPIGETVDDLPSPTMGSPDAPVTVEVFTDFECPHCRTFKEDTMPVIESEYVDTGDVQYVHRDWPIPAGPMAWEVASGARAVQDRAGNEAFFDFMTAIFDHQDSYTLDAIEDVATEVTGSGDDGEWARESAMEFTYEPVVAADKAYGLDVGVEATPSVAVDGELVDLTAVMDAIETAVP